MAKRAIIRAADADREAAAERLRKATAEGRLLTDELEERLEAVFAARTYGELEAVTRDLPREPSSAPRGRRPMPIPWPAAVLAFMILMPMVVALVVAAVVLVASVFALWALVAGLAMWLFGHRARFVGPRVWGPRAHRRAWHAGASRWHA